MKHVSILLLCTCCVYANDLSSSYYKREDNITFQPTDLRGSYYSLKHLVVDEEHKFIFCPIEKVASSMFRQLFFRLTGDPYWFEQPYYKPHRTSQHIGIARMSELFNDPTYTKAIFFRDPALRMLSAYTHFFNNRNSLPRYAKRIYDLGENNTFEAFVRLSLQMKIRNIHWNPQHRFCGFDKFYHKYTFIGAYEQLATHGRQLFDRVSPTLWSEFGAQGWSLATIHKEPLRFRNGKAVRNVEKYRQNIPPNYNQDDCIFCDNYAVHKYNCTGHACSIQRDKNEVLTPELWRQIRDSELYKRDYELIRHVSSLVGGPLDPDLYESYPFDS